MNYTKSNSYTEHAGTGQRMHDASKAIPTQVSDSDLNMIIWSLMEVVKGAGLQGVDFSADNKASYQQLAKALGVLYSERMEYQAVPTSNKGLVIVVTRPHLRMMVWDGARYVRAPWHQPCQLFFSYDNPASITGALPVRADVSYQQANYPDLVARLGLSGSGTFTLAEARGEFIRVLDNGRGVDGGRVVRSFQDGTSISRFIGRFPDQGGAGHELQHADGVFMNHPAFVAYDTTLSVIKTGVDFMRIRPRNVAYPLWITY